MTLQLTKQQYEYIMQALAQRPYAEVAQLINDIVTQVRDQEAKNGTAG